LVPKGGRTKPGGRVGRETNERGNLGEKGGWRSGKLGPPDREKSGNFYKDAERMKEVGCSYGAVSPFQQGEQRGKGGTPLRNGALQGGTDYPPASNKEDNSFELPQGKSD